MSKRGRAIRSEHALDCALCQARAYAEVQLVPIRFLLVRVRRDRRLQCCAGPGRPVAPCPSFLLPDRLRPLQAIQTLLCPVARAPLAGFGI